jgi:hypothetical protein
MDIDLNPDQSAQYFEQGNAGVEALAKAIGNVPKAYVDRHIKPFFKWPKRSPSQLDEAQGDCGNRPPAGEARESSDA